MGTAPHEPGGVEERAQPISEDRQACDLKESVLVDEHREVGIPSGHLLTRVGAAQRPEHTGLAAISPPSGRLVALTGPAPLLHHSPCICQEPQRERV